MAAVEQPWSPRSEDASASVPNSARGLLEVDSQTPMKGPRQISEEEFRELNSLFSQMMGCLRQCELIFFVGVPLLGIAGASFTTMETGFPLLFYLGYIPFLLANKGIELHYLSRWRALDPVSAQIQQEQWNSCSLEHPLVLIYYGVMEHLDLFLDVVFVSTAWASGYKMLATVSAVSLVVSVVIQLGCSSVSASGDPPAYGRNVYIPLIRVWFACKLQGMCWLGDVSYLARFGRDNEDDHNLVSNMHFATIISEQVPQMILQSLYFRWTLEDLTMEARLKNWASILVSIGVMLNNARQETCLFCTVCLLTSVVVLVIILPAEIVNSEIVWV